MTARLYEVRGALLPPNASPLTRELHVLGVYEARVLAMGELFDDAVALLEHVLDRADLPAIGPCALAAGAAVNDVARLLGRWIEIAITTVEALGVASDHRLTAQPRLAKLVRAALVLTQSTAPDGDLAYGIAQELIGARVGSGYAIVVATGHTVSLVGRRVRVGAGSPAAIAGDLVRGVIEGAHGPVFVREQLAELARVAREVLERAGVLGQEDQG